VARSNGSFILDKGVLNGSNLCRVYGEDPLIGATELPRAYANTTP